MKWVKKRDPTFQDTTCLSLNSCRRAFVVWALSMFLNYYDTSALELLFIFFWLQGVISAQSLRCEISKETAVAGL